MFVVNPQSDGNKAEIRASRTRLFLQDAHSENAVTHGGHLASCGSARIHGLVAASANSLAG